MKTPLPEEWQSGQKTAKKACEILVARGDGFVVPTSKQKANLLVAFAKKGKLVYGRAFDIVKSSKPINLDDLSDVEKNLKDLLLSLRHRLHFRHQKRTLLMRGCAGCASNPLPLVAAWTRSF